MSKTRSFGGANQAIWECVKLTSQAEHGTKYEPEGANQGTSTTSTAVGEIVLSFNFDPSKETVAYAIQKKPLIVSDDRIWNGIQETTDHCSR